jgi:hypothetical protein
MMMFFAKKKKKDEEIGRGREDLTCYNLNITKKFSNEY